MNKAEVKLAIALKEEALELAAVGDAELHNGETTRTLSSESREANKRRAFAEISVWHFTRAAEKYGRAAARFEEAGRIHVKKIQGFNKQALKMRRRAEQAAAAVNLLNNFLKTD